MTTEKAIYQLTDLIRDRESFCHRDDFDDMFLRDIEACKAGIQALEKQVLKKPIVKTSYICGKKHYCSECKYYICADYDKKNLTVPTAVRLWIGVMKMNDDLISRQAAEIAFIEKGQHSRRYKWGEIWELNGLEIREVLDNLPSVQPKEKTGHWNTEIGYDIERTVMCDQCRRMAYEPSCYCPNCGAKMEA